MRQQDKQIYCIIFMYESCIQYNTKKPLILIHEEDMNICDGDVVAASLLSYLIYWHTWKLKQRGKNIYSNKIAERHEEGAGDLPTDLWQFHTTEELLASLYVVKSPNTLRAAIKLIERKGFVKVGKNPNPRFKFDNTKYFLIDVKAIQDDINLIPDEEATENQSVKNDEPVAKNSGRANKNSGRANKNNETITENSFESTNKITSELNIERSDASRIYPSPQTPIEAQYSEVFQPVAMPSKCRTGQDTNGVQNGKVHAFGENPNVSGNPPIAPPPPCEFSLVVVNDAEFVEDGEIVEELSDDLKKILERYTRGEIKEIPLHEVKQIAKVTLGAFPNRYRFDRYILGSSNDIRPDFKQYVFESCKFSTILKAINYIKSLEKDPNKHDDLRTLVTEWENSRDGMTTKQVIRDFKQQESMRDDRTVLEKLRSGFY